jgi:hypothetical protein
MGLEADFAVIEEISCGDIFVCMVLMLTDNRILMNVGSSVLE